jgi:hypothetical protein
METQWIRNYAWEEGLSTNQRGGWGGLKTWGFIPGGQVYNRFHLPVLVHLGNFQGWQKASSKIIGLYFMYYVSRNIFEKKLIVF